LFVNPFLYKLQNTHTHTHYKHTKHTNAIIK